MRDGLIPGVQAEVSFTVTADMRPIFDGRPVHDVCSTWSLVHFMELASRQVLLGFLEPHEEGVGRHVHCDHVGPAPVGHTIRVAATVAEADARRLLCDVTAHDGARLIATGRTEQRVFPREVLERMLRRHVRD